MPLLLVASHTGNSKVLEDVIKMYCWVGCQKGEARWAGVLEQTLVRMGDRAGALDGSDSGWAAAVTGICPGAKARSLKWSGPRANPAESKPRDGNVPSVRRGLWTSWNSSSKTLLTLRWSVFHVPRSNSATCRCVFAWFCILAGMRDGSPTRDRTQGTAVKVPNPNH